MGSCPVSHRFDGQLNTTEHFTGEWGEFSESGRTPAMKN
jgi:hypothetical protein